MRNWDSALTPFTILHGNRVELSTALSTAAADERPFENSGSRREVHNRNKFFHKHFPKKFI